MYVIYESFKGGPTAVVEEVAEEDEARAIVSHLLLEARLFKIKATYWYKEERELDD